MCSQAPMCGQQGSAELSDSEMKPLLLNRLPKTHRIGSKMLNGHLGEIVEDNQGCPWNHAPARNQCLEERKREKIGGKDEGNKGATSGCNVISGFNRSHLLLMLYTWCLCETWLSKQLFVFDTSPLCHCTQSHLVSRRQIMKSLEVTVRMSNL